MNKIMNEVAEALAPFARAAAPLVAESDDAEASLLCVSVKDLRRAMAAVAKLREPINLGEIEASRGARWTSECREAARAVAESLGLSIAEPA